MQSPSQIFDLLGSRADYLAQGTAQAMYSSTHTGDLEAYKKAFYGKVTKGPVPVRAAATPSAGKIGSTASGKSVFASHVPSHAAYGGFSAADHKDAAGLHGAKALHYQSFAEAAHARGVKSELKASSMPFGPAREQMHASASNGYRQAKIAHSMAGRHEAHAEWHDHAATAAGKGN